MQVASLGLNFAWVKKGKIVFVILKWQCMIKLALGNINVSLKSAL